MYTINCNATTKIKKKAVANKVMREIKENHKKTSQWIQKKEKREEKGNKMKLDKLKINSKMLNLIFSIITLNVNDLNTQFEVKDYYMWKKEKRTQLYAICKKLI